MKAQRSISLFISCLMLAACSGGQTLSPNGGPPSSPAALGGLGTARVRVITMPVPGRTVQAQKRAGRHTPGSGQLVEFDAPGAQTIPSPICDPFCGTQALSNNSAGVTVGTYTDTNIVPHGFIRASGGAITSFDAPGAGLGANLNQGTVAYSISDSGLIGGEYQDSNYVFHSFVRARDGSFTEFDVPGAGTGAFQGTVALNINNRGDTAGAYWDSAGGRHGFVRSSKGAVATFDPPGSVFTFVCTDTCLNEQGVVTGYYLDASFTPHGFVRAANGQITAPIDAPGAVAGTVLASINANGASTGYGITTCCTAFGILRSPGGAITPFNVPGAASTFGFSINASGAVTGLWNDGASANGAYERGPNGTFALFNAPGALYTQPSSNNASAVVVGYWPDQTTLMHGFVWTPGGSQSRHRKR